VSMSANDYLKQILAREAVDTSANSPVRGVQATLAPIIQAWAGTQISSVHPSGSFAKGTANRSGTDIDLFISLKSNTSSTLKEIYESLFSILASAGYTPKKQNVSINIKVGGYDVDLVPAKRQDTMSQDHSLYRRRADTWTKTNVVKHIAHVQSGGRLLETRVLKLWRNQKGLDFPSFYLELTTMNALAGNLSPLPDGVWKVFSYLRDTFPNARVVDPANTNNVISDDLHASDRNKIRAAAIAALGARDWNEIVR
jgi:hypothetical protein